MEYTHNGMTFSLKNGGNYIICYNMDNLLHANYIICYNDLEVIMLSEISQSLKDKYYIIPLT